MEKKSTDRKTFGDVVKKGIEIGIEAVKTLDPSKNGRTDEKINIVLSPFLSPGKVSYSKRTTVVFWKDGTVTSVRCAADDTYDREAGLAYAYLKKLGGNTSNGLKKLMSPAKDASNIVNTDKKSKKTKKNRETEAKIIKKAEEQVKEDLRKPSPVKAEPSVDSVNINKK